jgi:SAM-dependent MidA family methyltransferase
VADLLEKGFVITIDYGYPSRELYQDYRKRGTLMAYYRHQAQEDPYVRVGEQDLTAHVNFSALAHWGRKWGLDLLGFVPQNHFLLGLGILDLLSQDDGGTEDRLKAKTLLLPGGMGEIFKVLIQSKGLEPPVLRGLSGAPRRTAFEL